jgi:hypothetical protein
LEGQKKNSATLAEISQKILIELVSKIKIAVSRTEADKYF